MSNDPTPSHDAYLPTVAAPAREVVELGPLSESRNQPRSSVVGTSMAAASIEEVRGAIMLAKQFPRDEERCRSLCMRMAGKPRFAEKAMYGFHRGGKLIEGLSIVAVREIARHWGNLQWGSMILEDTPQTRTMRTWAWDLEVNVKRERDITFAKLMVRKDGQGNAYYAAVDERDLQIITGINCSKGERDRVLDLLPWDFQDDLKEAIKETKLSKIKQDPEAFRKGLLDGFGKLGVLPEELIALADRPIRDLSNDQLLYLDNVLKGIQAGEMTWYDVLRQVAKAKKVEGDYPPRTAQEFRERVRRKVRMEAEKAALAAARAARNDEDPSVAEPPLEGEASTASVEPGRDEPADPEEAL